VRLVPYVLFGTLGGVVADRYRRKWVMIVSDLARAAVMALLGLVDLSGGSAAVAIGLAGLATTFAVAYGPAEAASLQLIVDEDELAAANSVTTTIMNVCIAIGPAVGGVLLAASPEGLWLVTAAVLTVAGLAALPLERFVPEHLRRAPLGARATEPVPLPVQLPEQETAQVAG